MNTADFLVDRLKTWGVTRIFGYSGDGINGVIGAIQRDASIDFIQPRHEEMGAFMAVAHAKFTGELGVCLATGGPGATHLITGLYDAKLDHMPVLAICGQPETTVRGASYQQELNLDRLFADVAEYVQEVTHPAQLPHVIDRAVRLAIARRGPSVVVINKDVQEQAFAAPRRAHGFTRSGPGYTRPVLVPAEEELEKAADILNAGEKVAILIGAGAIGASDEVIAVAEKLRAGVAKALLGKSALPDDLPFVTGCIGLLGTRPSSDLMNGCDTLLIIGSGFPWSEFLPKDGAARAVQIDVDAAMLSLRYPCEVNLHGTAAETLRLLLPLLNEKSDRRWREEIESGMKSWWQTLESRARTKAHPVNPQRVVWEMSPRLPDDAIVTSDAGNFSGWPNRFLQYRRPGRQLGPTSGAMGYGAPAAVGASIACPGRIVVGFCGDGGFMMTGQELATALSEGAAPIILVFNNAMYGTIRMHQERRFPGRVVGTALKNPDFAALAAAYGCFGAAVSRTEEFAPAFEEAVAAGRPAVIELRMDPEMITTRTTLSALRRQAETAKA